MKIVKVEKFPHNSERRRRHSPTIVYIEVAGENLLENLMNRKCRPYTAYKHLLNPHLQELGIPADAKLAWNRRAGCSCPCSPGFNVKRKDLAGNDWLETLYVDNEPVNIFVTISAE